MNQNHRAGSRDLRERVLAARLHEPSAYLGLHAVAGAWVHRLYAPHAASAALQTADGWTPMDRLPDTGIFLWSGRQAPPRPVRVRVEEQGVTREFVDAYTFAPAISDFDLHLFAGGKLFQAYRTFGANPMTREGVDGVSFAVWAPNAERVSVVGDFNRWDGRTLPMNVRGGSGVWELFVPGVAAGACYKFEIRNRATGAIVVKTDPYAQSTELRPANASIVPHPTRHEWRDAEWMARRAAQDWLHAPMNIYELHVGSWRRHPDGRVYTYRELADALIPYVRHLNYTHVELLPVTEHPLDESWGYQTTGYFAPTRRYGDADGLREFIDRCHAAGIGVLLDWVPGHFPSDDFGLAHFDGTALYEHEDPRLKRHPDWGTHVFNYGRAEVRAFLLASACYWLEEFHFDGLRVDAVASMLYLDYSRRAGEWLPNRHGGRENLEAIDFLREMNTVVHERYPGALTVAEESTAWPMVSRPVYAGGLGFSMKWNMGWMHDTLAYMKQDPVHRRYHHDQLTFGQLYAYSENFVLPFSHDEVVHGKGSLAGKMPGDEWQRYANLRLLAAYQATYPGKKLSFMGAELGQMAEWSERRELDWAGLGAPFRGGLHELVRELNRLYRDLPALHELDFRPEGFSWIDCSDASQSVISYRRMALNGSWLAVVCNFTPVPRTGYRIGMPQAGEYVELLNTDSRFYGGTDVGNGGRLQATAPGWNGAPYALTLTLPPLAALILAPV